MKTIHYYFKRLSLFLLAVLALLAMTGNSRAEAGRRDDQESVREVSTLEELRVWHDSTGGDAAAKAGLVRDIIIDKAVTLKATSRLKLIQTDETGTPYCIRIAAGGILEIDNPQLQLHGIRDLITVESGGTLKLSRGQTFAMSSEYDIRVKQGGILIQLPAFVLKGKGVLSDAEPPTTAPELPTAEPPPTAPVPAATEPVLPTTGSELPTMTPMPGTVPQPPVAAREWKLISRVETEDQSVSCMEGEIPDRTRYPSSVRVWYDKLLDIDTNTVKHISERSASLPVEWDVRNVDFGNAGTYQVKGTLVPKGLEAAGFLNPKNLQASLIVIIQKKGTITNLTGELLSFTVGDEAVVKLTLPILPPDVTAIHLYQSQDRILWEEVGSNFLSNVQNTASKTSFTHTYRFETQKTWFRVGVIGSSYEGMTNLVRIKRPDRSLAEEDNYGQAGGEYGEGGDYGGNSGGNYGGDGGLGNTTDDALSAESGSGEEKDAENESNSGGVIYFHGREQLKEEELFFGDTTKHKTWFPAAMDIRASDTAEKKEEDTGDESFDEEFTEDTLQEQSLPEQSLPEQKGSSARIYGVFAVLGLLLLFGIGIWRVRR